MKIKEGCIVFEDGKVIMGHLCFYQTVRYLIVDVNQDVETRVAQ